MQTFFKIFIIIVSLFIPLFLIFACIMLQWLIFGEGSGAAEATEKYNNMFITAYGVLAIGHGSLLYKLFRNDAVWVRVASLIIVGAAYVLTPYNLNTIW
jgi:hypothetical protein